MSKRERWNKATVVALAGDMADAEGLESLTLTKLALAMGVRTPSVFNHVESLAGLVRDLGLAALADLEARLSEALDLPGSPQESLGRMLGAYRTFVNAHPGRYAATLAIPTTLTRSDPDWAARDEAIVTKGLQLAARFGLEGSEALHALRGWRALAHGFSDLERRGGFGIPLDCDQSFLRAIVALTPVQRQG